MWGSRQKGKPGAKVCTTEAQVTFEFDESDVIFPFQLAAWGNVACYGYPNLPAQPGPIPSLSPRAIHAVFEGMNNRAVLDDSVLLYDLSSDLDYQVSCPGTFLIPPSQWSLARDILPRHSLVMA